MLQGKKTQFVEIFKVKKSNKKQINETYRKKVEWNVKRWRAKSRTLSDIFNFEI